MNSAFRTHRYRRPAFCRRGGGGERGRGAWLGHIRIGGGRGGGGGLELLMNEGIEMLQEQYIINILYSVCEQKSLPGNKAGNRNNNL